MSMGDIHPPKEETFVPLMNLSVGARGLCRWAANLPEYEWIEMVDGVVTRRVNRILTTVDYDEARPWTVHGAQIVFGRVGEHFQFQTGAISSDQPNDDLVRTAMFYRDRHGRQCAEGDLNLIAMEIEAMQSEEGVLPDARGLVWPTHEHIRPDAGTP